MVRLELEFDLFKELLLLCSDHPEEPALAQLGKILDARLEGMIRREIYSKSKTALDPAEREAARQEYLERAGIPEAFRWGPDGPV